MDGVTHTRARAWLHAGRFTLNRQEQAVLDSHLHDCRDCRGYAAYLAAIEPALTRALHTRWDSVRPPALATSDHAAHSAAAPSSRWAIPVLAGLVTLIAAILLGGQNLARQAGIVPFPTASQTARPAAAATLPLATAAASATPSSLSAPTRLIAFVSRQTNGNDEIYVMQANGGHLVNVSHDPGEDDLPAWSPDGQQLAFISNRTGANTVYLVRPDGTDLHPLPTSPASDFGDVTGLAWSPDGSQVVFTRQPAGQPHAVVQLAPRNGKWTIIQSSASQPGWAPDGQRLAFIHTDAQGFPALYVGRTDGTQATEVVTSTISPTGTHELLYDYAWSPDSARLAYMQEGPLSGEPPNQQFLSNLSAQIYTVRPDGSDGQLLLDLQPAPNGIVGVNWSPNGKYLLYSASVGMTGCMHIHLLEVATRVDTELGGVCHALRTALPAWSADSDSLAFTAEVENDPSQGAFVVLLNVPEALRNPAQVSVARLPGSAAPGSGPVLDLNPVWQPAGK